MVKNYTVVLPNAKRQRSRRADVRNSLWWELSPPLRGLILSMRSPWKDVRVCTRPHSLSEVRCRVGSKTGSGKDQPIREKKKWNIWLGFFNLWILFRPKHTFILVSLLVLKIWWIIKTVLSLHSKKVGSQSASSLSFAGKSTGKNENVQRSETCERWSR